MSIENMPKTLYTVSIEVHQPEWVIAGMEWKDAAYTPQVSALKVVTRELVKLTFEQLDLHALVRAALEASSPPSPIDFSRINDVLGVRS